MRKAPIELQDLRRRIYVKAKAEPMDLVGRGGVGAGCMRGSDCTVTTGSGGPWLLRKRSRRDRPHNP